MPTAENDIYNTECLRDAESIYFPETFQDLWNWCHEYFGTIT